MIIINETESYAVVEYEEKDEYAYQCSMCSEIGEIFYKPTEDWLCPKCFRINEEAMKKKP
jgi:rubrerythrin